MRDRVLTSMNSHFGSHSGCGAWRPNSLCYFVPAVYFMCVPQLVFLEFRNFYAAFMSVDCLYAPDSSNKSPAQWHTLVPRARLMHNPHSEKDAQSWHRLRLTQSGASTRCALTHPPTTDSMAWY